MPSFHTGVRVSFMSGHYSYSEDNGQAFVEVMLTGRSVLDVVVLVKGGMF